MKKNLMGGYLLLQILFAASASYATIPCPTKYDQQKILFIPNEKKVRSYFYSYYPTGYNVYFWGESRISSPDTPKEPFIDFAPISTNSDGQLACTYQFRDSNRKMFEVKVRAITLTGVEVEFTNSDVEQIIEQLKNNREATIVKDGKTWSAKWEDVPDQLDKIKEIRVTDEFHLKPKNNKIEASGLLWVYFENGTDGRMEIKTFIDL